MEVVCYYLLGFIISVLLCIFISLKEDDEVTLCDLFVFIAISLFSWATVLVITIIYTLHKYGDKVIIRRK